MMTEFIEQTKIPQYLTVKDLQRVFRCGRDKAYKICSINGFPKMIMHGTILIHPDALQKWMNRNQTSEFM